MDGGLIASRYAKALLKFVTDDDGGKVCAQAETIERALDEIPKFRRVLDDPEDMTCGQKLSLLKAALGDEAMEPKLETFLALVLRNRRVPELRFILHSFVDKYYLSKKVRFGRLVTASAAPGLSEKLKNIFSRETGFDVVIEEKIDPSIIGGFVFSLGGTRVDASVARQIETLRQQFIEKNRRIV